MNATPQMLQPVGVREAKNRFSELAAEVNATGLPLEVLKNGKPWVTLLPASADSSQRNERLRRFRALTKAIEDGYNEEPEWDASVSDKELLDAERVSRFD